jgi:predicted transglutaminase-like cysteine proteinase
MPMIVMDQAHWAQLEQVQVQVDHQVKYVSDMERFGVGDWWEPAKTTGDCEDIALTKRQRLMDMGWPAESLRIAALIDGHGDLHAVLTVDVESLKGAPATYVLDSHFAHVEPWQVLSQYGYYWLERSKPGSSQWARLDGDSAVGSQKIASLSTMIMPASPRWDDRHTQYAQVQPYEPAAGGRAVSSVVRLQMILDEHVAVADVTFDARVDSHARLPAMEQASAAPVESRPAVTGQTYKVSYISSR